MTLIFACIIGSGLLGGTVNFMQLHSDEYTGWTNYWKCVIIGIGAAFLVPLFLQMISSTLIIDVQKPEEVRDVFIFISFCLLAAIFSRKFIESLGEKLLQQVRDANTKSAEATVVAKEAIAIAEDSKNDVELIAANATEVSPEELEQTNLSSLDADGSSDSQVEDDSKEKLYRLLEVFRQHHFIFRSITGLCKDMQMEKTELSVILNRGIELGYIQRTVRNSTIRYSITKNGKLYAMKQTIYRNLKEAQDKADSIIPQQ